MHLKVKSKQSLAELIQRHGIDAIKREKLLQRRQDKLIREKAKRNARRADQVADESTNKAGVKKASPHTPGAAD